MKSKKRIKPPEAFVPSDADQRAGPSPAAGTFWGTGIKNPVGKIRGISTVGIRPVSRNGIKTPPKALA